MENKTKNIGAEPKMKWFKFIIYFLMFAMFVFYAANSVFYLTGLTYKLSGSEFSAQELYSIYGGRLKTMDYSYGVALAVLAVLSILTRFRLSAFKKDAPALVCTIFIADAMLYTVYSILADIMLKISSFPQTLPRTAVFVIIAILNAFYFKKRKDFFAN